MTNMFLKTGSGTSAWSTASSIFIKLADSWIKVWPFSGVFSTRTAFITASSGQGFSDRLTTTSKIRIGSNYFGNNAQWDPNGWVISTYQYAWRYYPTDSPGSVSGASGILSGPSNASGWTTTTGSIELPTSIWTPTNSSNLDRQYLAFDVTAIPTNSSYQSTDISAKVQVIRRPPQILSASSFGLSAGPYNIGTTISYSSSWNTTEARKIESGRSTIKWYHSSSSSGLNRTEITRASGLYSFTILSSDNLLGKYIVAEETVFNSGSDYDYSATGGIQQYNPIDLSGNRITVVTTSTVSIQKPTIVSGQQPALSLQSGSANTINSTYRLSSGSWTNSPTQYKYWLDSGGTIVARFPADGVSYTTNTSWDHTFTSTTSQTVSGAVVANNGVDSDTVYSSNSIGPISQPFNVGTVSVSGGSSSIGGLYYVTTGATLTVSTSGWPAGTTFSYQWIKTRDISGLPAQNQGTTTSQTTSTVGESYFCKVSYNNSSFPATGTGSINTESYTVTPAAPSYTLTATSGGFQISSVSGTEATHYYGTYKVGVNGTPVNIGSASSPISLATNTTVSSGSGTIYVTLYTTTFVGGALQTYISSWQSTDKDVTVDSQPSAFSYTITNNSSVTQPSTPSQQRVSTVSNTVLVEIASTKPSDTLDYNMYVYGTGSITGGTLANPAVSTVTNLNQYDASGAINLASGTWDNITNISSSASNSPINIYTQANGSTRTLNANVSNTTGAQSWQVTYTVSGAASGNGSFIHNTNNMPSTIASIAGASNPSVSITGVVAYSQQNQQGAQRTGTPGTTTSLTNISRPTSQSPGTSTANYTFYTNFQAAGNQRRVTLPSNFINGTLIYISTNGWINWGATDPAGSIGIPSSGITLAPFAADLRQTALWTFAESTGFTVRWQGAYFNDAAQTVDYQVRFNFGSPNVDVHFVSNNLTTVVPSTIAVQNGSTVTRNWSDSTSQSSTLLNTATMTRNTSRDTVDDNNTGIFAQFISGPFFPPHFPPFFPPFFPPHFPPFFPPFFPPHFPPFFPPFFPPHFPPFFPPFFPPHFPPFFPPFFPPHFPPFFPPFFSGGTPAQVTGGSAIRYTATGCNYTYIAWSAATNAATYQIFRTTSSTTTPSASTTPTFSGISLLDYNVLSYSSAAFYFVRGVNSGGVAGPWSARITPTINSGLC